jgi:stearoyl-CoA desaturase (Delta-9 desaturase)
VKPASAAHTPVVHAMPAAPFVAAQRRHFVVAVVLPTLLSLVLPWLLPPALQPWHHAGLAAALLLGMWFLVGGLGVSVGLHRLFSHRSFEAAPPLRVLLGVLGAMAAQGPAVYWVSLHRMHHAASDLAGDPHSPCVSAWPGASRWRAAWQGHVGWVLRHDVPKPTRYARELLADPLLRRLNRAYPLCVVAGVWLPAAVGWAALGGWQGLVFGAYWGGVLRIALGHHIIWAINSWCHLAGCRDHDTADASTNVAWLALLSWGESWHNNHHARPAQARFGQGWRQPDVGWWLVQAFVVLGWARLRAVTTAQALPPQKC